MRYLAYLLSALTVLILVGPVCVGADEMPPGALRDYVSRSEPDFAWNKVRVISTAAGTITELRVTSQKWHDNIWEHAVEVFEPKELVYPGHAVLFITGGSRPSKQVDPGTIGLGTMLAQSSGMRVVILHQVPNQPLFDGRFEDDLITETWLKYLQDGDETWPLLFPMVKSAVKTMDAVQELARQDFNQPIHSFVVTGASKRGWTSWLTPVADDRVVATAPIVIDTLNFRKQMKHQLDVWGRFSEQIHDYTSKGLIVQGEESGREQNLRLMMDPYTYRSQLSLPKLLVNGTNDPYWVVDAMSNYWDDLSGEKYAIQIPNAGHGLDGGRELAMRTIGAFSRHVASKRQMPRLSWSFQSTESNSSLTVACQTSPECVRLWSADSTDSDFRDEEWTSVILNGNGSWTGELKSSQKTAMFAELQFKIDNVEYSLCTLIYRR